MSILPSSYSAELSKSLQKHVNMGAWTGHVKESLMGDVLVFETDEGSRCTTVFSPYTGTAYYTIAVEGLETVIYRGKGKDAVFSRSKHVATVSAATSASNRVRETFWNLAGMMSSIGGTSRSRAGNAPESTHGRKEKEGLRGCAETEKDGCVDDDDNTEVPEKQGSEPHTDPITESSVGDRRLVSARGPGAESSGMVFVRLGQNAFAKLGDCLRIEKSSVTITYDGKIYSLRVAGDGQPAIHVVGEKNGQVIWTRPPQMCAERGKLHPASVTFYPEVRPFLDAIIVALVVWEKMNGVSVQV